MRTLSFVDVPNDLDISSMASIGAPPTPTPNDSSRSPAASWEPPTPPITDARHPNLQTAVHDEASQQQRILGSYDNLARFSSDNSLRIDSPSFVPGRDTLSSGTTMTGAVVPCTPPFQPFSGSLFLFASQSLSSESAVEAQDKVREGQRQRPTSQSSSIIEDGLVSPAFITLPNTGSVLHSINGWLTEDLRLHQSSWARAHGADMARNVSGVGAGPVMLLRGLSTNSNAVAPSEMPPVDSGSLNGFLTSPSGNKIVKSGGSNDPDGGGGGGTAVGVGVMSVSTSRSDLMAGEEDEESGECGWLCFRPKALQKTRTANWVLFWLCWAAIAQGMVVNGFINVCITTIEKRYDLRSTDTGLIAGAYDMASVLCSLPVSYLGSRPGSSKPRWVGWGIFIMGIGSFVFTLPHFASPTYDPSGSDTTASILYCLREGVRESPCSVTVDKWLSSFRHIFVFGQFLHGVGASPLYTLGITYLDESIPVRSSSVYLGIFYAMAVMGPAIGYLSGGQFLKIYIDAPTVDPAKIGLRANSDLWLGGWWIGFLVSGTISILISWPIMAFPSQLPGAKAIKAERVSQAQAHSSGVPTSTGGTGFGRLKDLPKAVCVLTRNPTFVAVSFAGTCEGLLLTGFATFTPKFLENQFSMSASYAALLVGFVVVPTGGGGTLFGGWLVKRLQLRCSGILKLCLIFSLFCLLSCLTFVIYCPNIDFAGVNVDYQNRSLHLSSPNLSVPCNENCSCWNVPYDPICGSNNVTYFSPCHAGCSAMEKGMDGLKVFTGCRCVSSPPTLTSLHTTSEGPSVVEGIHLAPDSAVQEKCPTTCKLLPFFLIIFFIVMMFTFIISLPSLSSTLRCVPDTHRSFALGLQSIVVRLLGTIPGPILFGALIDKTCTLWQSSCGVEGACRNYNNFYMSRYMMGISIIGKSLSSFFFFLAWWLYIPPKCGTDTTTQQTTSERTVSSLSKSSNEINDLQRIDNPTVEIT